MIVPMKKLSVVCLDKDKVPVLEALGRLGTVHIHQDNPQSPALAQVNDEIERTRTALQMLEKTKEAPKPYGGSPQGLVQDIMTLQERIDGALTRSTELVRLEESFKEWGDFTPEDLKALEHKGLFPVLYSVPLDQEDKLSALERKVILGKDKVQVRALSLQSSPEPKEGLEMVPWPELSPSQARQERQMLEKDLQGFRSRMKSLAVHIPDLEAHLKGLEEKQTWESAKASLGTEEKLAWFTGYVPVENWAGVKDEAAKTGFGVQATDPEAEDAVPTKIQNKLIPRIIAPVFAFLGTVPGYRERDISLPFLGFFMVFFSMIIGDGGYGLIFLALGLLMGVSSFLKTKKVPDMALLTIVLSSATVVWGAVTGTWFGNLIALGDGPLVDFLKSLTVQPFVDENYNTNVGFVKWLCFTIGIVQLILAHLWNFVAILKGGNFLKSLAQLGGMTTSIFLYPVVLGLVITGAESTAMKNVMFDWFWQAPWFFAYLTAPDVLANLYLAAAGVGVVILFGNQEGNFVKGLVDGLSNILNTALGAVSWFSDNISYIRLFAVGLAGFAIAESFNGMGVGLYTSLGGGAAGFAAASLVILFGHGLNLIMALLGVLVHGVRLNLLEFSSRLGMEWVGFEYKPLVAKSESKS